MSVTLADKGHGGLWRDIAADLRRMRRIVRRRFVQTLFLTCGAALIAGIIMIVTDPGDPALRGSDAEHVYADESPWIDIARPFQFFALPAPELARLPRAYEARRHRTGGGREDVLTFGAFDPTTAYVRLTVHRLGGEPGAPNSFFVDLARRGAEAGLAVTRSSAPSVMSSRFGPVEAGEMVLSSARADNVGCLAFRFAIGDGAAQASGFACGGERSMERASLACLIDRLDLMAASEDALLRKAFAASELRRDPACGPKGSAARAKPAALETPASVLKATARAR